MKQLNKQSFSANKQSFSTNKQSHMQIKTGVVVSTKMEKTPVVEVTTYRKHPLYKKQIKKTTNFKTHDDLGVKVGQKVKIAETRPIAKDVHFKILEVIS